jgi:hypothetical protein
MRQQALSWWGDEIHRLDGGGDIVGELIQYETPDDHRSAIGRKHPGISSN